MTKLAQKFVAGISIILCSVILLSLFVNSRFAERFYLYQKKEEINQICDLLEKNTLSMPASLTRLDDNIETLERTKDVVIVRVKHTSDNDKINGLLRSAFLEKGLGLSKYWLWINDYEKAIQDGRKLTIYRQDKLNYSLLVEYLTIEDSFVAVAMVIPNVGKMVQIINLLTAVIFLTALVIMIFLILLLVKRITMPLSLINKLAEDISNQNFHKIEVHTKDELEAVAISMNTMSEKLQTSQIALLEKNRQMELLLGNVSHDLKTPVALIKAYATGIKDGMDDSTFVDTIIRQNEKMERMIERLLDLARLEQSTLPLSPINIGKVLEHEINEQMITLLAQNIELTKHITTDAVIAANKELLTAIFSNLISNAIHYTKDNTIQIKLYSCENHYIFEIMNGIAKDHTIELPRIWDPFYVGEKSRNKDLSGTGLGLSIVGTSAQKSGFGYDCTIQNQNIIFTITFPMERY